jgi:hypothetical protein
MKFGDPLIYIENGKEIPAIVLRTRVLDDHMGANGEPLVDLGFFQQVTIPGTDGKPVVRELTGTDWATDMVQFRIDVPHVSHGFTPEAQEKLMAIYGGTRLQTEEGIKHHCTYPGGRWKELTPPEPEAEEAAPEASEAPEPGSVQ